MKRIKMKDVECPCCEGKGTVIANTELARDRLPALRRIRLRGSGVA